MISVQEAKDLIEVNSFHCEIIDKDCKEALGFVLAEDLVSPIDSPPFHQSAMDGYAFRYDDLNSENTLVLQGIIQAGDTHHYQLERGKCFRIFTGAPLPLHADTVIMQEHTELNINVLSLLQIPAKALNVRLQGSQIRAGNLIIEKGKLLNAGIIGFLISSGIQKIKVYAKPKVSILITGKELVQVGNALQFGQIYESNSSMLQAALQEGNLNASSIEFVDDDLNATKKGIANLLASCDVLLISGGISVGDFDYVQAALEANGVECIFYKVKQKPGKPLYFGKKDKQLIFALPGNPAAVLTCFYEYVVPCLRMFRGMKPKPNNILQLPLITAYHKKGELTHFLKAKMVEDGVILLDGQESYKLQAFTEADCLVIVPSEINNCKVADEVEVHVFKNCWT